MKTMREIMRIVEGAVPKAARHLDEKQRHAMLKFVYQWLTGSFMNKTDAAHTMTEWQAIAALFPPKLSGNVPLYRVVTLPINYAKLQTFSVKPALTQVSSWCSHLGGLDPVVGIAREFDHDESKTTRLAFQADIPADLILATPSSIRKAFTSLAHDYMDRYPEDDVRTREPDGTEVWRTVAHPDYPGGPDDDFSVDEVGYMLDVVSRRGGHMRQYECIVRTPPSVQATVVRIYRVGHETLRQGNDDPHN